MNYHQKLQKVINFIGEHLDEEMSLDSLSHISCLSKFHFHRLFTAFTVLSLLQYIKWLRLKRAAHQLIVDQDQSIINIAINNVVEKYLPAGRYAVAIHQGSRNNIGDTVYALYRDWLPNSGEQLGDLPCVFCYHNFEHEVAETALLTECWLLLK